MTTDKGGRPPVITSAVLQQLEGAFSVNATDAQACLVAGISVRTLYNYQEVNPEFLHRKEALKGLVGYQAKINLANQISKNNLAASQWLLERKEKESYSTRTDITTDGGPLTAAPIINVTFIKPKKLTADEDDKK